MADLLGKLVIERIEDVVAFNPSDDKLLFILDEPTQGSLECAQETVWATGKSGRRLYGIDNSKTSTFNVTNGYLVLGALAAQSGATVEEITSENAVEVPVLEYIKPENGKLTLAYTPVAGSVKYIYESNSDLTQGKVLEVEANGKEITIPSGSNADTYIVTYDRTVASGSVIINDSENYSLSARVIFTILCHPACDINKKIYTKLEFPNSKISGNFTLDISGDQVVQEMQIEALSDVCSINKVYWRWIVVGDTDEIAALPDTTPEGE